MLNFNIKFKNNNTLKYIIEKENDKIYYTRVDKDWHNSKEWRGWYSEHSILSTLYGLRDNYISIEKFKNFNSFNQEFKDFLKQENISSYDIYDQNENKIYSHTL